MYAHLLFKQIRRVFPFVHARGHTFTFVNWAIREKGKKELYAIKLSERKQEVLMYVSYDSYLSSNLHLQVYLSVLYDLCSVVAP